MPEVALVRLRYAPKEYFFEPNGLGAKEGDHVVVDTERGREIGLCVDGAFEVDSSQVRRPLKPITRIATDEDLARSDELAQQAEDAMPAFRELVHKHGLDMKPIAIEFLLDGSHGVFYFTADERVDFRELVRDIAGQFHVRVDMRQVGVRDEARILGGLGHCGEELCCCRMGGEFEPVSIRMAKAQDLPLNPSKISGLCGRLMCCLRYEYEAYKDFKKRAPKKNGIIETPAGLAKVVEFDTPRERVRVRLEDGKSLYLPVDALDTGDKEPKPGENLRPCHISEEMFDKIIEELNHDKTLAMMGDKMFSDNPDLADITVEGGSIERMPARQRRRSGQGSSGSRSEGKSSRRRRDRKRTEPEPEGRNPRNRRRSVSLSGDGAEGGGQKAEAKASGEQKTSSGKRRRRRGGRGRGKGSSGDGQARAAQQGDAQGQANGSQGNGSQGGGKPRPGQHSSSLSGDAASGEAKQGSGNRNRRRRRRGGRGRGGSGSGGAKDAQRPQQPPAQGE